MDNIVFDKIYIDNKSYYQNGDGFIYDNNLNIVGVYNVINKIINNYYLFQDSRDKINKMLTYDLNNMNELIEQKNEIINYCNMLKSYDNNNNNEQVLQEEEE